MPAMTKPGGSAVSAEGVGPVLMTLAFIVVAFSAQALAWRCAKLDAENERLKEQLRHRTSTTAPKSTKPLVWK